MGRGQRAIRTRSRPHPLLAQVRRFLPRPAAARTFLTLLQRRLEGLEAVASGGDPRLLLGRPQEATRARRFLAPRVGSWDDGDEALVRAHLDRWTRGGEDPIRAAARRLAEAARALGALELRAETLWFFLWEMESILAGLSAGRTQRLRKP